eukprot:TRINITY_DN2172_c0_g1_i2.p1 TRINITY_DN2172_c0_g1~~TRINITY_DN2172_c0_g1_i2.p1  ORF type:complete len:178 (+),score=49.14 TRINITY_DN2172_c0_g1_i2:41-574(+)
MESTHWIVFTTIESLTDVVKTLLESEVQILKYRNFELNGVDLNLIDVDMPSQEPWLKIPPTALLLKSEKDINIFLSQNHTNYLDFMVVPNKYQEDFCTRIFGQKSIEDSAFLDVFPDDDEKTIYLKDHVYPVLYSVLVDLLSLPQVKKLVKNPLDDSEKFNAVRWIALELKRRVNKE